MNPACPYCRAPFEPDDEVLTCEACATPHHADCYAENGGCTVFGCSRAPVDEPKISISSQDLNQPAGGPSRPPGAGFTATPGPTPPPPMRPGSTTAVPPPPPRGAAYAQPRVYEDTTRYLTPPRDLTFGGYNEAPRPSTLPAYIPRRSRLTYILLGVFLGAFGGHNFYAGYIKRAIAQLLITVLTCFWGALISWIWAIVEICIVTQDDDGVAFT
jgi:TM2 domain-containing membrane protein YozV